MIEKFLKTLSFRLHLHPALWNQESNDVFPLPFQRYTICIFQFCVNRGRERETFFPFAEIDMMQNYFWLWISLFSQFSASKDARYIQYCSVESSHKAGRGKSNEKGSKISWKLKSLYKHTRKNSGEDNRLNYCGGEWKSIKFKKTKKALKFVRLKSKEMKAMEK